MGQEAECAGTEGLAQAPEGNLCAAVPCVNSRSHHARTRPSAVIDSDRLTHRDWIGGIAPLLDRFIHFLGTEQMRALNPPDGMVGEESHHFGMTDCPCQDISNLCFFGFTQGARRSGEAFEGVPLLPFVGGGAV